jgi:hypothetical protein
LWIALAVTGCAAGPSAPSVDAMPAEVLDMTVPLISGQLAEGLWNAKPGDQILVRLTALTSDLDWNIHAHVNGGTQTVVEEFGTSTTEYLFDPPTDAQWYLLLRNHGTAEMQLVIHLEIFGAANWAGWQN